MWCLLIASIIPFAKGMVSGDPCSPSPCGQNAQCIPSNNQRAVCSCPPGYAGDPLTYCKAGECQYNEDCRNHEACRNNYCVNVCTGACAPNADCSASRHVAVCKCLPGFSGNGISSCTRFDPEQLCYPSPCGRNTKCEVVNGVPTCSCLPGYYGSPLSNCRHECESDEECDYSKSCQNFKCRNPCQSGVCAPTALCEVQRHRAVCSCPKGYFGDPSVSCRAECETHRDCSKDRPTCSGGHCVNPCAGVCGVNANCEVRGATAICSCPKDMTGDPFVRCRPFEPEDLCKPNPCGENAKCEPGYDNTGKDRPVCTCYPGYVGNALTYCRKGECSSDQECSNDQICLNYECKNACSGQCGVNAICTAKYHTAVCSCPAGFTGSALTQCYENSSRVGRRFGYDKK